MSVELYTNIYGLVLYKSTFCVLSHHHWHHYHQGWNQGEDEIGKTSASNLYSRTTQCFLSAGPLGFLGSIDTSGATIISDNALQFLIPPQLKNMIIKHKAMCGCEFCIIIAQFQSSLNAYQLCLLRRLENGAENVNCQEISRFKSRS